MENFVLEQIFLEAFNISLTAGWVIAVVLLLRALLKPVPKKYVCLLWFVVLFRLLCPVTLESEFSLVPQHEEVKYEIVYTTPQMETNSEPVNNVLNQTVNPVLEQTSAPNPMGSVNPLQVYIFIAAWIWIIGMIALCGYTLISWIKMRYRLAESIPDGNTVYLSDTITSPFVFGILKPKIYLPYGLEDDERRWVLLHEQSHIARKDYIVKPLFWLAVMIHWMNPLVWIAWFAFSRDLELACDERATASMNGNEKWNYSNTLLALAVEKHRFECPVAFSNNSVKERIERILKYKQLPKVIIGVVLVLLMVCGIGLSINPVSYTRLGDLRPELDENAGELEYAILIWGSVQVELRNPDTIEELRKIVANLNVKEVGEQNITDVMIKEPYMEAMENAIFFGDDENPELLAGISLNGFCDKIDIFEENGEYLKVKEPEMIRETLAKYCKMARGKLGETTFNADLTHDGIDEMIVYNPNFNNSVAVYKQSGEVLYSTMWTDYYGAMHLHEKDGKNYLLYYVPMTDESSNLTDDLESLEWYLIKLNEDGSYEIEDRDVLTFQWDEDAEKRFDAHDTYTFLNRLNGMLDNAFLLCYSGSNLEKLGINMPYSKADYRVIYSAEYYLPWSWLNSGNLLKDLTLQENRLYGDTVENQNIADEIDAIAEKWAKTYAERDGQKRYELLNRYWQRQIDNSWAEQQEWMPYRTENGAMSLRGSSPWVDSWDIDTTILNSKEKQDREKTQYFATITYNMIDSSSQKYIYAEQIEIDFADNEKRVSDCKVTIELQSVEIYEQVKKIVDIVENGHETWRLDQKQVIEHFAKDYLGLKDGEIRVANANQNSFYYETEDEQPIRIYLYQPAINQQISGGDFWAVRAYEYPDMSQNGTDGTRFYDVRENVWASLHIRE